MNKDNKDGVTEFFLKVIPDFEGSGQWGNVISVNRVGVATNQRRGIVQLYVRLGVLFLNLKISPNGWSGRLTFSHSSCRFFLTSSISFSETNDLNVGAAIEIQNTPKMNRNGVVKTPPL